MSLMRRMLRRLPAFCLVALVFAAPAVAFAQHEEAEAGGHGGGHHAGPPHINWVHPANAAKGRSPGFLYALINFGGLIVVLGYLMRKPLKEMVSERYDSIMGDIADAKQRHAQAEARLAEYERKLAGLDEERRRILADILAEGETEKQKLIAEAKEQAARMRAETQFLISQEMKKIRGRLEQELVDRTFTTAEAAVKVALTEADQRRLVDQFIAELAAEPKQPKTGTHAKATP